jgi:GNAT superfamily N-acetyltransferase
MADLQDKKPFIRLYNPKTDAPAIHHIVSLLPNPSHQTIHASKTTNQPTTDTQKCQATLPSPLRTEPAFSISPCIWANPYIHLYPQNCFVLDSGTGITAVGYIIGTPSTRDFVQRYRKEYIPTLDAEKFPRPKLDGEVRADSESELPRALLRTLYTPEEMLHEDFPAFVEDYPAHLHIDLLPEYQRRGFGRLLMDSFCERLKRDGARGVHLVMGAENKNGMFYERMGFGRWPVVLDGGWSGEVGRHEGGIWLVKKLE